MIYVVCFVTYFSFLLCFVFVSYFYGPDCFVGGTLAFYLLDLDELRLFGLLCLTVCDCDHSICISLG